MLGDALRAPRIMCRVEGDEYQESESDFVNDQCGQDGRSPSSRLSWRSPGAEPLSTEIDLCCSLSYLSRSPFISSVPLTMVALLRNATAMLPSRFCSPTIAGRIPSLTSQRGLATAADATGKKLRMIILGAPGEPTPLPYSRSARKLTPNHFLVLQELAKARKASDCSRVSSGAAYDHLRSQLTLSLPVEWDISTVVVGDLLRREIQRGTELGKRAAEVMKAGGDRLEDLTPYCS